MADALKRHHRDSDIWGPLIGLGILLLAMSVIVGLFVALVRVVLS